MSQSTVASISEYAKITRAVIGRECVIGTKYEILLETD